jgi:hypothetical protein
MGTSEAKSDKVKEVLQAKSYGNYKSRKRLRVE